MALFTGAILSPRSKLASAKLYRAVTPAPPQFARLAQTLNMWGNDTYGDCVSAESFAAKAADGIIGTDAECIAWARANGGLNGANLTDVMDYAVKHGITIGGKTYYDGPYQAVVYTDYTRVSEAIFQGSVKIAVAAAQLQRALAERAMGLRLISAMPSCEDEWKIVTNLAKAGQLHGWVLLTARRDSNIDHCTGLHLYGQLSYACQQLKVSMPAGADPAMPCVGMFSWASYGVVSFEALLGLMDSTSQAGNSEAWLRVPTTVAIEPTPTPTPTPVPPTPTPWHCPWNRSDVDDWITTVVRAAARGIREGVRE